MTETFTAFLGQCRAAQGRAEDIAAALGHLGPHPEGLLVFSDSTGRQVDLNLSGTPIEERAPSGFRPSGARKPGRPKLGVKAREVTLLPRHWDWLAGQRGGASASLRRLVEDAMRTAAPTPDAAYAFLTAIGGDLPGYETAIRALFANDPNRFARALADWPEDIRDHAIWLAPPDSPAVSPADSPAEHPAEPPSR